MYKESGPFFPGIERWKSEQSMVLDCPFWTIKYPGLGKFSVSGRVCWVF